VVGVLICVQVRRRAGVVAAPVNLRELALSPFFCGIEPSKGVRRCARKRGEGKSQRRRMDSSHRFGIGNGRRRVLQSSARNPSVLEAPRVREKRGAREEAWGLL
jgi:hypothetical protein